MPKVRRPRSAPAPRPTPEAPRPARRTAGRPTATPDIPWRLIGRVAWAGLTLLMLWITGRFVLGKITWYLAVDQFGYLTFAHDLLHGHVFHDWAVTKALEARLPPQTDVLAQTYVWDHGRLWCRYAIGFPLVLAGWLGLFGDDRAVYLNTTAYLALIVVTILFQRRITRSPWRATVGAALLVLYPTYMHLWSLTLTRDMVNHLVAVTGLLLLLPARGRPLGERRTLASGVFLGFAGSIRPDGVLYAIPAALLCIVRWRHHRMGPRAALRPALAGILGALIGLSPGLAYNYATQGNPFMPSQGMEAARFFEKTSSLEAPPPGPLAQAAAIAYPPPGWHGGTITQVQGGGLKLEHLQTTLPGNFALLVNGYGAAGLVAASVGAVIAAVLRPMLFVTAVPYVAIAMFFYGCWARPDNRYLLGVFTFLPMLIVEGTTGIFDVIRIFARRRNLGIARGVAVAAGVALVIGALAPVPPAAEKSALPGITGLLMGIAGGGALLAAVFPTRRIAGLVGPLLVVALVVFLVNRVSPQLDHRATFQHPEVVDARYVFGKAVEPNSVVISTEDIGRPAENIEYYSGVAHSLYLTDVTRWRLSLTMVAATLIMNDMRPYLLLPTSMPGRSVMLDELRRTFSVDVVADIPPDRAIQYFVAAPFHRGVRLELMRISAPELERRYRESRGKTPAS